MHLSCKVELVDFTISPLNQTSQVHFLQRFLNDLNKHRVDRAEDHTNLDWLQETLPLKEYFLLHDQNCIMSMMTKKSVFVNKN